jgi:small subunit ribosomal protein S1
MVRPAILTGSFRMANETIDTEADTQEPGVWTTGPDGELVPDYEATFPEITEGEVVHGTVVRVDKDEVLVDIGYKSEGVIPVAELSIRRSVNPDDEVGVGDEIDALVLTKEDSEGRLILSKKRARFELAWKEIERKAESGEPITGRVIEVVKGGLILDLGVRGFLPASLVDIRRVQDLDEFLAQELRCKVIELNRSRNNVVLSRRAVLEDERKEMRQAILDRLSPGDVVDGTISNIVDFGAFVDLDGMDGLIHISELSWGHVNHPSEVLDIGQEVKVKVLDIDRERQRISLGLKQTQSDPWQQVLDSYSLNDIVEGKVTKVVTFGAFVEILPGVEGLVHISELAQHHVENPREVVAQGQAVQVKIIEMDAERRRLSLSLKRVDESEASQPRPEDAPPLALSEEVFSEEPSAPVEEAVDEEAEEQESAQPAAEAQAEEPVAETEAEEPVAEVQAEEPVAEIEAEEPVLAAEVEEPVAEAEAEEPAAAAEAEEPVAEVQAEEPVAEIEAEEPVLAAEVEEPVAEAEAEEPVAAAEAEEPVAEAEAEQPVAEAESADESDEDAR